MPRRPAIFLAARLAGAAVAACAICTLLWAAQADAQDRLNVSLSPDLSPHWFRREAGAVAPAPREGEIVALGELNLRGDAPTSPSNFRLRSVDQEIFPLQIDKSTLVREFGKVVFFRFFVNLPERLASQAGLVFEWGDEIHGPNALVAAIHPDPAARDRFREIVFSPSPAAAADSEERQLELKVIAGKEPSRYRLLYLLPIALVLASALVRTLPRNRRTCDP